MTVAELLTIIAQVSGLLGIVGSMLAMGLGLTLSQIIQPLKNARLVVLALLANFVLVPLLAYGISLIFPLDDSLKIGLLVLANSAGASAIFLIVRHANAAAAISALKPYKGEVYHTSLSDEDEATLRRVLDEREA
jgi:predicted Na+-dependent transporter